MRAIFNGENTRLPDYRYITFVIETTGRSEKRRKKSAWIAEEKYHCRGQLLNDKPQAGGGLT
jgi:hypothetical protein